MSLISNVRRAVVVAAIAIGLAAACAAPPTSPPPPKESESATTSALPPSIEGVLPGEDPAVVADCKTRGGRMIVGGLLGKRSCVIAYKDAGKTCTDGDQCEGQCLGQGGAMGAKATGKCQPTSSPFGCLTFIEDGTVGPTLCVD